MTKHLIAATSMSTIVNVLQLMRSIFNFKTATDIKTYVPRALDIKEVKRIIETKDRIIWIDCNIDDHLPRANCIFERGEPKFFHIIFEKCVKLPAQQYPIVGGIKPLIKPETPAGICIEYPERGFLRTLVVKVATNELISILAEEIGTLA